MLTISKEHAIDTLACGLNPAARCQSGDTVVFETRDCYDDNGISESCPMGTKDHAMENPATGPLFIEDALPGDILKVEILDIRLRDYGVMRSSTTGGAFHDLYQTRQARIFEIKDGKFQFDKTLTLDCDTMIGVIGTAPAGNGIPTVTPDCHGGNMDCRKIVCGSILYLPVNTEGALLAIGDLHARMGDGEVFICGLETAGEVTVRLSVVKGCALPTPFLVCEGQVMSIQSAKTLDEAGMLAVRKMQIFVKDATGLDDLNSGMLMSLLCNMAVCQIVDPLVTMRAEFPLDVLEQYGYHLP